MANQNNAVQIDQFFAGVRGSSGSLLGQGMVIAYVLGARNNLGELVYRRARLWRTADRSGAYDDGIVPLDANGLPAVASGEFPSVYGDGSLFLCYYAFGTSNPPDGTEEGVAMVFPPGQAQGAPVYPPLPFSAPDRYEVIHVSAEIVNAAHFGAQGNANYGTPLSGVDDTDALQAAIDYCLVDSAKHPKELYIPGGTYRITRPLVVMQTYDEGGGNIRIGYCAIHIHGEKRGLADSYGDTIIYAEFTDRPAMIIQGGYGVIVRNLSFAGVNRFDVSVNDLKGALGNDQTVNFSVYHNDNNYFYDWMSYDWQGGPMALLGKCRDNVQSPYAGIAIDPFAHEVARFDGSLPSGVPGGNQYPGFSAQYHYVALDPTKDDAYTHSSGVIIENCAFLRFVVGIIITPSGRNKNAENIVIRNVLFQTNKVGLAICQSQTRGVQLENCAVLQCQTVLDCRSYGAGSTSGTAPNIRGLTVSEAKFLFNINAGASSLSFDQIYAEAFLSIGYLGGEFTVNQSTVNITGSTFDFLLVRPAINTHLFNFACVKFSGCMFIMTAGSNDYPPLMFTNKAPILFENCSLQTGRHQSSGATDWGWANSAPAWGFHEPLLVRIEGVRLRDNVMGGFDAQASLAVMRSNHLSVSKNDMDVNGLVRQILPPGARIAPVPPTALFASAFQRAVKGDVNEIVLANALVTANGNSLLFSGLLNRLLPGDVVYAHNVSGLFVPKYKQPSGTSGEVASLNPDDGYGTVGPIGVITATSSLNNTIGFVPTRLLDLVSAAGGSLTVTLKIKRFGRYHPATVGDLRAISPAITNVVVEGYANASAVWRQGDRVSCFNSAGAPLIDAGTYVLLASTNTIVLSRNPNADATGARLFDADVYRFVGTGE